MKLVSFEVRTVLGPVRRIGALLGRDLTDDSQIVDLNTGYGLLLREGGEARWREIAAAALPPEMLDFLAGGEAAMQRARQVLDFAPSARPDPEGRQLIFARDQVRLLAPLPRPASMRDFSEYEEHMTARLGHVEKPAAWYHFPMCYKGNPDAVYGPDDPMYWPDFTEKLDPELELAAVIGRRGRNLTPEEAGGYIAGYTIFCDGSARDVQSREMLGPYKAKDFGTILGPCIVTPDEFDEMNASCGIRVNGELWWEGNSGFRRNYTMADLVAYTSDEETIQPGDVIAAGTIGFSCSMDSNRWIKPGDVVEQWIEGIGTLKHTVVRRKRESSYTRDGLPGRLPVPDEARDYVAQFKAGAAPPLRR